MHSLFHEFTHVYPVQKTLRFALKPMGKTIENIQNFRNEKQQNLLAEDEERALKYKQAKKIIDEYHKAHIHNRLSCFEFPIEDLERFKEAYSNFKRDNKDDEYKKALNREQDNLRKKVASQLIDRQLFQNKFIRENLPKWLEEHEINIADIDAPKSIIEEFDKWTTYFSGFNKNRKNIYSQKSDSTSIGHRLIHENLPRFLDNIEKYKTAKEYGVDFSAIGQRYEVDLDTVFTLGYFNQCLTQIGIDAYNLIRGGQGMAGNQKDQGINEKINLYAQQLDSQKTRLDDEQKKAISVQAKAVRSCKLQDLYKQILSDRTAFSIRLENIESDGELCKEILHSFRFDDNNHLMGWEEHVDQDTGEITESSFDITAQLKMTLGHIDEADPKQVYVK
ncbi:MAG: hypothetical protein ACPH03_06780, partial [Flavobacteriaceae bacterium]